MNKKKIKRNLIIVFTTIPLILFILFFVLPLTTYAIVYKKFIDKKFPPIPYLNIDSKEYPNLVVTDYSFRSNHNQKVNTVIYKDKDIKKYQGLVVVVHGYLTGGHGFYMPGINFFAQNGYLPIAIDITGNGQSLETTMKGMEQGVIDLERLIKKIKNDAVYSKYKLFLYGHSMGAHCVSAVLNFCPNDVDGVVAACGFDNISDEFLEFISIYNTYKITKYAPLLKPYIKINSFFRFGKYSNLSALDGLKKTSAKCYLIASEVDRTVPDSVGYNLYYNEFKNNKRFTFKHYFDKEHETIDRTEVKRADFARFNSLFSSIFVKNYDIIGSYKAQKDFSDALFNKEVIKAIDIEYYQDIINFFNGV